MLLDYEEREYPEPEEVDPKKKKDPNLVSRFRECGGKRLRREMGQGGKDDSDVRGAKGSRGKVEPEILH